MVYINNSHISRTSTEPVPVEREHEPKVHCIAMAEEDSPLGILSDRDIRSNNACTTTGLDADHLAVQDLAYTPVEPKTFRSTRMDIKQKDMEYYSTASSNAH